MGGVGRISFQTNSVVSFDELRDTKRVSGMFGEKMGWRLKGVL